MRLPIADSRTIRRRLLAILRRRRADFALVFALPVLAIYFVVNRKFGFRFYGGIKS